MFSYFINTVGVFCRILSSLPECPTVRTSIGSDPLRRTSSASGFSGLRCSKNRDKISECDSGKSTVSGPPELRLLSCFFLRPAFPFRLVCLVSCSRRSPPPPNIGGRSVGAEPLRGYCKNDFGCSTGVIKG